MSNPNYWPDIITIPGTSITANLGSVICNAPRGGDQYQNVSYYGSVRQMQPTGAYEYNLLNNRLGLNTIVIAVSG